MSESFDDLLDSALGAVLSSGWDDDLAPAVDQHQLATPKFPPLPMREPAKRAQKRVEVATPNSTEIVDPAPAPVPAIPGMDSDDDETDQDDAHASFGIGLLTDLATGRKTPQEAAAAAGLPLSSLQEALATELRNSSADDIAKALAIQASEQQLKSGAIYGAVLFDLVRDMSAGRLQPKEKIKFAELLSAVGKIMPKESKDVSAGGGFTLNIQMNGAPSPVILSSD